jgi:hypothetical protein
VFIASDLRFCAYLPSKQAVAGSPPEDWLLAFSFGGRSGLGVPRLPSRTTGALPARDGFHSALTPSKSVARMRLGKAFHDNFLRRSATVVVILLAAFSRPLSRYLPLLDRPPVLRLWCADGTSSAQRTLPVMFLHSQMVHGEEARTMPHPLGKLSLWRASGSWRSSAPTRDGTTVAPLHRHTEEGLPL